MRSSREFIKEFRDSLSDIIDKDLTEEEYIQLMEPYGFCTECKKSIYNKDLYCRKCGNVAK